MALIKEVFIFVSLLVCFDLGTLSSATGIERATGRLVRRASSRSGILDVEDDALTTGFEDVAAAETESAEDNGAATSPASSSAKAGQSTNRKASAGQKTSAAAATTAQDMTALDKPPIDNTASSTSEVATNADTETETETQTSQKQEQSPEQEEEQEQKEAAKAGAKEGIAEQPDAESERTTTTTVVADDKPEQKKVEEKSSSKASKNNRDNDDKVSTTSASPEKTEVDSDTTGTTMAPQHPQKKLKETAAAKASKTEAEEEPSKKEKSQAAAKATSKAKVKAEAAPKATVMPDSKKAAAESTLGQTAKIDAKAGLEAVAQALKKTWKANDSKDSKDSKDAEGKTKTSEGSAVEAKEATAKVTKATEHHEKKKADPNEAVEASSVDGEATSESSATPVDCRWDEWASWSNCSKTCGGGSQSRDRSIKIEAANGGKECKDGDSNQIRSCNTQDCGEDCVVDDWTEWSNCTGLGPPACTLGDQIRSRAILQKATGGGKACPKLLTEKQTCRNENCTAGSCEWSEWSAWSVCKKNCSGSSLRYRSILKQPANGSCTGSTSQSRPCATSECGKATASCGWSDWSEWSPCSTTCNPGRKARSRTASNTSEVCQGSTQEQSTCNTALPCPVNCTWTQWSPWGDCSHTCGHGRQVRVRGVAVKPKHGGHRCAGGSHEWQRCASTDCPSDCTWSEWSAWTSCSARCNGTRMRFRGSRAEMNGGKPCDDLPNEDTTACNINCKPGQNAPSRFGVDPPGGGPGGYSVSDRFIPHVQCQDTPRNWIDADGKTCHDYQVHGLCPNRGKPHPHSRTQAAPANNTPPSASFASLHERSPILNDEEHHKESKGNKGGSGSSQDAFFFMDSSPTPEPNPEPYPEPKPHAKPPPPPPPGKIPSERACCVCGGGTTAGMLRYCPPPFESTGCVEDGGNCNMVYFHYRGGGGFCANCTHDSLEPIRPDMARKMAGKMCQRIAPAKLAPVRGHVILSLTKPSQFAANPKARFATSLALSKEAGVWAQCVNVSFTSSEEDDGVGIVDAHFVIVVNNRCGTAQTPASVEAKLDAEPDTLVASELNAVLKARNLSFHVTKATLLVERPSRVNSTSSTRGGTSASPSSDTSYPASPSSSPSSSSTASSNSGTGTSATSDTVSSSSSSSSSASSSSASPSPASSSSSSSSSKNKTYVSSSAAKSSSASTSNTSNSSEDVTDKSSAHGQIPLHSPTGLASRCLAIGLAIRGAWLLTQP